MILAVRVAGWASWRSSRASPLPLASSTLGGGSSAASGIRCVMRMPISAASVQETVAGARRHRPPTKWPRWDSNPHPAYARGDFKSPVSAIPPRGPRVRLRSSRGSVAVRGDEAAADVNGRPAQGVVGSRRHDNRRRALRPRIGPRGGPAKKGVKQRHTRSHGHDIHPPPTARQGLPMPASCTVLPAMLKRPLSRASMPCVAFPCFVQMICRGGMTGNVSRNVGTRLDLMLIALERQESRMRASRRLDAGGHAPGGVVAGRRRR